jgi:hypothetical protein
VYVARYLKQVTWKCEVIFCIMQITYLVKWTSEKCLLHLLIAENSRNKHNI